MLRILAVALIAFGCSGAVADEPTLVELKLRIALLVESQYASVDSPVTAAAVVEEVEPRKPLPKKDTGYTLRRGDPNDRSIIDNGEALPQPGDQTIGQPEGESFNGVTGESSGVSSCPCGIAGCSCPAGECDCGDKASATIGNDSGRILYLLSTDWCRYCPAAESNAKESGVSVSIIDGESAFARELWGDRATSFPGWVLVENGKPVKHWYGASSTKGVRDMLAFSLPPTDVAAPAPVAASVGFQPAPQVVRRSIPPARRTWTYRGSDLAAHVRNTHGIDTSGMSYSDLVKAHSHAHEGTWSNSYRGGYVASQPVRQYASRAVYRSCPNCPR